MKTLHKHQANELTITEQNGRINVRTKQEVEIDNYYMKKEKDTLEVFKLIIIGAGIAFCLALGYGLIKIF
jgi:hypothetical protein